MTNFHESGIVHLALLKLWETTKCMLLLDDYSENQKKSIKIIFFAHKIHRRKKSLSSK